jgi:hypothetical protein
MHQQSGSSTNPRDHAIAIGSPRSVEKDCGPDGEDSEPSLVVPRSGALLGDPILLCGERFRSGWRRLETTSDSSVTAIPIEHSTD